MSFGDKLALLMNIFNISGKELAKTIHVDPSLVSKWQKGRRKPTLNSQHYDYIAEFFLGINPMEYQRDKLNEILRSVSPGIDLNSHPERRKALIEWFMTPENNYISPAPKIKTETAPFKLPGAIMRPQPGEIKKYELFSGKEGKRQVVLNVLSTVLTLEEPVELLITSQDDTTWLYENRDYIAGLMRIFKAILDRGHKITVIYKFDRSLSQIMAMLDYWLPLCKTGRMQAYYYTRHEDSGINTSIYIARGIAAIVSMTPENESGANRTFLYRDPDVVRLFEANFEALLAGCRPVLKTYLKDEPALYDKMAEIEKKPGYFYSFNEELSSLTMPFGLYQRLLGRAGLAQDKEEILLNRHRQRLEAFYQNIRFNRYREIYPLEIASELTGMEGCKYYRLYFFQGRAVQAESGEVIDHIANIIELLKNNEHYEIGFIDSHAHIKSFNIAVKEESAFILSAWDNKGTNPIVLTSSESVMVLATEQYFLKLWEQIPRNNRNRDWVIEKFRSMIERLEKMG